MKKKIDVLNLKMSKTVESIIIFSVESLVFSEDSNENGGDHEQSNTTKKL